MVPVVKDLADLIQTEVRHGADQVHGNLPGGDRVPHPLLAPDHGLVQTVIFGDILKDGLRRGDILVAAAQHVLDGPGDGFFVGVVAQQILVGQDLVDGALQLADVGGDVFGDVGGDFVRQLHAQQGGLVFHDGKTRLKIRRRYVHQQSPLKSGAEAVLQLGHLRGGAVGGQDDLPAGLVQGVEGVEELLLRLLFAGDELHVVHQQQVRLTVLLPHLRSLTLPDSIHQLVGQVVALDVSDLGPGVVPADDVGDGIDQMGLAQAGVPVDQQGVVVLSRMLRHGDGGGISQLVGRAHHEGLECELRGSEPLTLAVRAVILELCVIQVVQNLHFKIRGENVVKGGLDVFHEPWYDSLVSQKYKKALLGVRLEREANHERGKNRTCS